MKAIYHCPIEGYPLVKSLGFTHVEVMAKYLGPSRLLLIMERLLEARRLGMGIILDPDFSSPVDANTVLRSIPLDSNDFVYLCDEPNNMPPPFGPRIVRANHQMSKSLCPNTPTMMVLDWTNSYSGFEDTSDFIGFDFYPSGKFFKDLETKVKLMAKIAWFKIRNKRSILFAVPGIKGPSLQITKQYKFWKMLGFSDFYWYSYTPNQDTWTNLYAELDELPDIQVALMLT